MLRRINFEVERNAPSFPWEAANIANTASRDLQFLRKDVSGESQTCLPANLRAQGDSPDALPAWKTALGKSQTSSPGFRKISGMPLCEQLPRHPGAQNRTEVISAIRLHSDAL